MDQKIIKEYLIRHPRSSKKEIKEGIRFDASDSTLKRILKNGVEEGSFITEGEGRACRYSAQESNSTAKCYRLFGLLCNELGEYEEALSYLEKGVSVCKKIDASDETL